MFSYWISGFPIPTAVMSAWRCAVPAGIATALFLTALDQMHEKLAAFAVGADDYLTQAVRGRGIDGPR